MITRCIAVFYFLAALGSGAAWAENCGGNYTVKPGDTLSQIADSQYKDARKWSAIYSNNLKLIGDDPNRIWVGHQYHLSCINGFPTGLSGGQTVMAKTEPPEDVTVTEVEQVSSGQTATQGSVEQAEVKAKRVRSGRITLLTAGDFKPFTDKELENGGMFNDIVETTMRHSSARDNYKVYWVEDWAAHLGVLLKDNILDMGYPWYKPDCVSTPDNFRCQNYVFSDPMFENLILLFTAKSNPIVFNSDADILGRTLCRPRGWFTHDLDKNGRRWLLDNKITLKRPIEVSDCFEMLLKGEVDGVAMNEFTGRGAIKKMGIVDQIDVVQSRPIAIEGLHVVVHKSHPQVDELITLINTNLKGIKENGEYQKVIDVHMTKIWEDF